MAPNIDCRPKEHIRSRAFACRTNATARRPTMRATRKSRPKRKSTTTRNHMIADRGVSEPIALGAALVAGKKVPPDATQLLMMDHRTVLGWFRWYEQAEDPTVR